MKKKLILGEKMKKRKSMWGMERKKNMQAIIKKKKKHMWESYCNFLTRFRLFVNNKLNLSSSVWGLSWCQVNGFEDRVRKFGQVPAKSDYS